MLYVRGAEPGAGDSLADKLREQSGLERNRLQVRPYTSDAGRVAEDVRRSSVVLMPSRSEGFGLVGLEALAFGVPILVSAESGLGELLRDLADDVAHRYVVDVTGDVEKDAGTWKEALGVLLSDREASFQRARELRDRLRESLSWDAAVRELVARIFSATT